MTAMPVVLSSCPPASGFKAQQRRRRSLTRAARESSEHVSIHIHRMPLEGAERIHSIAGTLYPEIAWHFVLLLATNSLTSEREVFAFDFVPDRPTSPDVFIRLLSLQASKGVLRSKRLPALPRHRTVQIASVREDLCSDGITSAVEAASARVAAYDSDLHLLRNNCRHFVAELASELSGVPINPWSLPSDPLHSARPSWTVMR